MKKIYLILTVIFSVVIMLPAVATVYTVNTTTGANVGNGTIGSLNYCINKALSDNTSGAHSIVFSIPGAGPYSIPVSAAFNIWQTKTITIDGTTQPGYSAANGPIVFLKGSNTVGFDLNGGLIHFKALGFQSFSTAISLNNQGANGTTIQGCWFGLDASGKSVTGTTFSSYAIIVKGSLSNVTIGSKTDFTVATRNVIAGCTAGGISFDGAGTGNYVGNAYIGTDFTGTIGLGNGTTEPQNQHGVRINNTPQITIDRSVISGNVGLGIYIIGEGSHGSRIVGNKIGTNAGGTAPIPNKAGGIRIDLSDDHVIGGTTEAERNIISGNGGATHQVEGPKETYDRNNQCGIYCINIHNVKIIGNYIGTDVTGNSTGAANNMGNVYAGIKLEGKDYMANGKNCSNNIIGGLTPEERNVIGGNGFGRPDLSDNASFKSHGILFKDKSCTDNKVFGNYLGVGADGSSNVGNRQDGVSFLGARNNTIGGNTPAHRNIISNNAWGVFIQSAFWPTATPDNASGNKVLGNYIGTDVTGKIALGNGVRTLPIEDTEGGGVCIQHNSSANVIGGTGAGEGNLISGNKAGIVIQDNYSATHSYIPVNKNIIVNNLVGLDVTGLLALPNITNGIELKNGATLNTIGGSALGSSNFIAGNGSHGILIENGDTNRIFNNYIGLNINKEVVANKGDGIRIQSEAGTTAAVGSIQNIIGGPLTGEGNTISGNKGNGINILDAASLQNSITHNSISCNELRGIELNKAGNANFAAPKISSLSTASKIEGLAPANSYIEVFTTDGCNSDCLSGKLQGKTFVGAVMANAKGEWVLNVTSGQTFSDYTKYTATASEVAAIPATAAAYNTSEFGNCYIACTPPTTLTLSGAGLTICQGQAFPELTVTASNAGSQDYIFKWIKDNKDTVRKTTAASGVLTDKFTPSAAGVYTVIVFPLSQKCSTAAGNPQTVVVNSKPQVSTLAPEKTEICAGQSTRLILTVNPTAGKYKYEWTASVGTKPGNLASPTVSPANTGATALTVNYSVIVTDTVTGCVSDNKATGLIVHPLPIFPPLHTDTTFCNGGSFILKAPAGYATYQWLRNELPFGSGKDTVVVKASGGYKVTATTAKGCSATTAKAVTVTVNPNPVAKIKPSNSTPCQNEPFTLATDVTPANVAYAWTSVPSVNVSGSNPTLKLLVNTNFTLKVTDNDTKCFSSAIASVLVKTKPDTNVILEGADKFCFGGKSTLKATAGYKQYVWKRGNLTVADGISNTFEVKDATQTGDYTVTVFNEEGCFGTSRPANVTVYAKPVLKITPKGDFVSCLGASELIQAVGDGTFQWYFNDLSVLNTTDTMTARKTGEYKVVLTDTQTKCFSADSVNMSFDGKDYAKIKSSRPDFCTNDSLKLIAAPENGIKFEWFFNETKITGATDSVFYAKAPGNYKVSVGLKGGCLDTSVSFPVEKLVNPSVTIKADTTEICADKPLNIKAVAVKGTAEIKSYTWNNAKTAADITETLAQTASFTVIVEDQKGCKDTANVTIKVNPNPAIELTSSRKEICVGESTKLNVNLSKKGTGTPIFHWSPASGLDRTDTAVAIAKPLDNVTYKIIVTDSKNCKSDTASQSIKVNKNPTVTASTSQPTICKGDQVEIIAIPGGGDGNYFPEWSNGNKDFKFFDKPSDTITYKLVLRDGKGCKDSSASVTVNVNARPDDGGIDADGSTTFCDGGSVKLSVKNSKPQYKYEWFVEGKTTSIKESDFYVADTTGKYSVKISMLYPDIVCSVNGKDTVSVKENPRPEPFALATPAKTSLCEGETVVLAVKEPVQAGVKYNWYKTGKVAIYIADTKEITVGETGDFTVIALLGDCDRKAKDTLKIKVNPNPVEKEVISMANNDFCRGDSTILKLDGPAIGIEYTWMKKPDIIVQSASKWLTVKEAGEYYATARDTSSGCFTVFKNTQPITVYENPVKFTVTGDTICHGAWATLRANSNVENYIWINLKTKEQTIGGRVHPVMDSSSYTAVAYIEISGARRCTTKGDTAIVKINALPDVTAKTINDADYLCLGGASQFIATALPEKKPGIYEYKWYKSVPGKLQKDTSVFVGEGDTLDLVSVDWRKYFVSVYNNKTKCYGADTVTFDLAEVSASIVLDTLDICLHSTQTLAAIASTSGPKKAEWSFSNDPLKYTTNKPVVEGLESLFVTGIEPGGEWYYLSVSDLKYPNCKAKDSVKVKVHGLPVVTLTSDKDTVCTGAEILLTATAKDGTPIRQKGGEKYYYSWFEVDTTAVPDFNVEKLKGFDSAKYMVIPAKSPATTYEVVISDSLGCQASDTIYVHPFPKQDLNIPNLITPNGDSKNDVLFITDYSSGFEIFAGAKISIYNRWGQAVYKSKNYDNKWDAVGIADGIYYYHLEAGCGNKDEYKGWLHIISNQKNSPFSE